MEQQTPIPPKSRMKPREGQKRAIFPSLIWGGGGSGGSRFSIYFVQDCRFVYYCSFKTNFCEDRPKISNSTARLIFNLFCVV